MSEGRTALLRSISRLTARDLQLIAAHDARGSLAESGGDVPVDADKVAALVDAVRVLHDGGWPHALIGGVAVGLHSGVPRATLDTDLAVATASRGPDLLAGMTAAGFELRGEYAHSVNFRHASGEPVQLAFDPQFDALIDRADAFEIAGVSVPVVSKDDLIAMKRLAAAAPGRRRSKSLRDLADVELLLGDHGDVDEGW